MSTADQYRASALDGLDDVEQERLRGSDDSAAYLALTGEASTYALLAVEARLGELVEQQRIGNTIAAFQCAPAVLTTSEEIRAARATVRDLLGLPTEDQTA
ncbi:hypothetical protein [Nocardia wallacei]|uniref:hypothetical protein n=1 Tax=Nocardia wallacei TaxID=480035 RepID=UPI002455BD5A|nr:hypothetical protein [Nocardia wallacei]